MNTIIQPSNAGQENLPSRFGYSSRLTPEQVFLLRNEFVNSPAFWTALRSFVRINQTQFALALGVSRVLVSKWERGVSQPVPRQVAQAQAYLESLLQQRLVEILDAAEKRYR